jgi:hypothetical protein
MCGRNVAYELCRLYGVDPLPYEPEYKLTPYVSNEKNKKFILKKMNMLSSSEAYSS